MSETTDASVQWQPIAIGDQVFIQVADHVTSLGRVLSIQQSGYLRGVAIRAPGPLYIVKSDDHAHPMIVERSMLSVPGDEADRERERRVQLSRIVGDLYAAVSAQGDDFSHLKTHPTSLEQIAQGVFTARNTAQNAVDIYTNWLNKYASQLLDTPAEGNTDV